MRRNAIKQLHIWRNRNNRKPLILNGARQTGKTWLMKQFATETTNDYIYINFEENNLLKNIFLPDFNIDRILESISLVMQHPISKNTLLLFDEIQEAPRGITSLKYFYENRPEIPIIAAGSLLGISLHKGESYPVGKVETVQITPMDFQEFLTAIGEDGIQQAINNRNWPVVTTIHEKIVSLLRLYYFIGGMPEAVSYYIEHKDLDGVRTIQKQIINDYDHDFSKHAPTQEVPRIRMVWNSIIGQLSKENKKFIYGFLKEGARAKEFETAIEWLRDAGLIYKVSRVKKGLLPLSAYEDFSAFKLYLSDIGLLGAMAGLSPTTVINGNALFLDAKGAFAEQYVLQQLKSLTPHPDVHYWSSDTSSSEIDFLIQKEDSIMPIEVKAETNVKAKSLNTFVKNNPGLHGIRLSLLPYCKQDWMTNIPLYASNTL